LAAGAGWVDLAGWRGLPNISAQNEAMAERLSVSRGGVDACCPEGGGAGRFGFSRRVGVGSCLPAMSHTQPSVRQTNLRYGGQPQRQRFTIQRIMANVMETKATITFSTNSIIQNILI